MRPSVSALGESELAKNYVPNMFQWKKGELEEIRKNDNKQAGGGGDTEDGDEEEGGGFKLPEMPKMPDMPEMPKMPWQK